MSAIAAVASSSNIAASVMHHLRATTPFLVDERPEALLVAAPPFGYSGDHLHGSNSVDDRTADVRRRVRKASRPPAAVWGSCAVVGNSGTLKLDDLGAEIDAHDAVFRVNHAPPPHLPEGAPYARYAGTRTTYRVVTSGWRDEQRRDPNARLLVVCDTNSLVECHEQPVRASALVHAVNPRFFEAVRQHAGSSRTPLAGLVAVSLALTMCGRVAVYGLSTSRLSPPRAGHAPRSPVCAYYYSCSALGNRPSPEVDVAVPFAMPRTPRYTDGAYHSRWATSHDFAAHARTLELWNASHLVSIRV